MLIDWFTVAAQTLNFIALVWLLQRFLYVPVLAAVAARDQKVALQLQEAAAAKQEAIAEKDEFQRKNEDLERQRVTLIGIATAEAAAERRTLLAAAQQEAAALTAKLREAHRREREAGSRELATQTQDQAFAIARKLLEELADIGLEERMAAVFLERFQALSAEQKASLQAQPLVLRSAFVLPAARQATLRNVLGGELEFEVQPGLLCGLELRGVGQKLAWNLADGLCVLKDSVHAS